MQTLAQNGYTAAEVEAELRYSRGFRELDFRYELLDFQNNYLRDIASVISCSIKQDYTQDIHRTAQLQILDDPTINYLNQRIKPWVQLIMPDDSRTYDQIINQYASSLAGYYKLDETSGTTANNSVNPANYPGTIGANVGLGQPGIVGGSSMSFPGSTASTGYINLANGSKLIFVNDGTTVPQIINAWSNIVFVNPSVVVSATIWRSSTNRVSLTFDASGNVVFSATSTTGATKTCTVPNPYGKNLRSVMVSWRLGTLPVIYLNGVIPDGMVQAGEPNSTMSPSTDTIFLGYSYTGLIDAVSFMGTYLDSTRAIQLHRAGVRSGPFGVKNYAEWPQGVFLLSSPSRALDTAGVVTRSIEAYDQSEVLTDDLIATRYVAQIGSLYMNNILALVLSYQPVDLSVFTPSWKKVNATTPRTAGPSGGTDSVNITGPTSAGANGVYTDFNYTLANINFYGILQPPTTVGNGTKSVRYRFFIDANNYSEILLTRTGVSTATVRANQVINGVTVATASTPWGASSTWIGKITEYNGYTIFQTIDNISGVATTLLTTASDSYLKRGRLSIEAVATGAESAWSVFETVTAQAAIWQHVNATPSAAFLPKSKDYDMGVSKLSIVNDLLDSIAYDHVFFDAQGRVVLRPYQSPSVKGSDFEYADNERGVVLPGNMSQTLDLFKIPNKWVASSTSPDGTSFSNINYPKVNTNANSPTSTVNRKRTITKVMTNVPECPDLVTLLAFVDKVAEQDSQVFEVVNFQSAIIPVQGDRDILQITNTSLGLSDKYEQVGWSFDMKDGAVMQHAVRKHVDIS